VRTRASLCSCHAELDLLRLVVSSAAIRIAQRRRCRLINLTQGGTMSVQRVQDHYASAGSGKAIAARIIAAVREHGGADVAITPDTLAPVDHLHGRGVLATAELVALLEPRAGEAVLDIGCGLGGPARWIAARHGCSVTGVDLTTEHCDAARELNAASGMADRVRILETSALALPLPDASFDRAYSHNVVMNIADKAAVYREAFRVLKPGGRLVLLHVNAGPNAPVEFYPVGWASVPENSFLATHEETRRDLEAAGFEIVAFREGTPATAAELAAARRKLEVEGLPPLGPYVIRVDSALQLQLNGLRAREDERVAEVQIVARKPR
jgi:ubiquinone/menaquinone biosynthesis C-methylase UbiE